MNNEEIIRALYPLIPKSTEGEVRDRMDFYFQKGIYADEETDVKPEMLVPEYYFEEKLERAIELLDARPEKLVESLYGDIKLSKERAIYTLITIKNGPLTGRDMALMHPKIVHKKKENPQVFTSGTLHNLMEMKILEKRASVASKETGVRAYLWGLAEKKAVPLQKNRVGEATIKELRVDNERLSAENAEFKERLLRCKCL